MTEQIVSALRLSILIGASYAETITWKSEGVLVPFPAGTTAEIKVRPTLASETVLLRFSTSPTATDGLLVLIDPGVLELSLTEEQTAELAPVCDAVFDIKYSFPTGQDVVKLTDGKGLVDIHLIVTRP